MKFLSKVHEINVARISNRTLFGKFLRLPLKLIPSRCIVPILQGKLRGKKWIVGSSNHGYWLGSYEYKKQIFFSDTIQRGMVVFDIGAHVGFYTLLSSQLVGSRGSVIAFEPLPENVVYLKKHIELNCISNAMVFEAAVSNCSGQEFFKKGNTRSTGHLVSEGGEIVVRTISLDDFINEGKLPLPDCLKIDVEGDEMNVFFGAQQLLSKHKPMIFLDVHGKENYHSCYNFFNVLGYALFLIDGKNKTKELIATVDEARFSGGARTRLTRIN